MISTLVCLSSNHRFIVNVEFAESNQKRKSRSRHEKSTVRTFLVRFLKVFREELDDCRKRAVAGACCAASVSLKQLKQQEPQQLLQLNMKYKYKRAAYDLNSAATTYDLAGAASGYGGYCPEGIPVETAIFGLLAAFGVAFGVLYRAVTLKTGGRRKKRDTNELDYKGRLQDFVWMGKKSS